MLLAERDICTKLNDTPAVTFLMKNVKHFIIFISYNIYGIFPFLKWTVLEGIAVVQTWTAMGSSSPRGHWDPVSSPIWFSKGWKESQWQTNPIMFAAAFLPLRHTGKTKTLGWPQSTCKEQTPFQTNFGSPFILKSGVFSLKNKLNASLCYQIKVYFESFGICI